MASWEALQRAEEALLDGSTPDRDAQRRMGEALLDFLRESGGTTSRTEELPLLLRAACARPEEEASPGDREEDPWQLSLRSIGAAQAAVEVIHFSYGAAWGELFPSEHWTLPAVVQGSLETLHEAMTACTSQENATYGQFLAVVLPVLAWLQDEVAKWADTAAWHSLEQRALTVDSLRGKIQEAVRCSWCHPAQRLLADWKDVWLGPASAQQPVLLEPCGTLVALADCARTGIAAMATKNAGQLPPSADRSSFFRAAADVEARWRVQPPLLPSSPSQSRQLEFAGNLGVIHRTGRRSSRIGLLFGGGLLVLCQAARDDPATRGGWRTVRVIRVVASGITRFSALAVHADSGGGLGFCIRGKEKSVLCFTDTASAREEWIEALSGASATQVEITHGDGDDHPGAYASGRLLSSSAVLETAMREVAVHTRARPGSDTRHGAPILIPSTVAWRCMISHGVFGLAVPRVHCHRCGRCVAPSFAPSKIPLRVPWDRKRLMRVCLECTRAHGVHLLGDVRSPRWSSVSRSLTPFPVGGDARQGGSVREDGPARRQPLSRTQSGPAVASGRGGVAAWGALRPDRAGRRESVSSSEMSISSDDSKEGFREEEDRVRAWYPSFDAESVSETGADSVLERRSRPATARSDDSDEATTPVALPPALPAARIEWSRESGGGFEDSDFLGSYEDDEDEDEIAPGVEGASMHPVRDSSVETEGYASGRSSRSLSPAASWRQPSQRGGEATAHVLHDFAGMAEDTVTVRRGDCIFLLGRSERDPAWLRIRTDKGAEGEIPEACVSSM